MLSTEKLETITENFVKRTNLKRGPTQQQFILNDTIMFLEDVIHKHLLPEIAKNQEIYISYLQLKLPAAKERNLWFDLLKKFAANPKKEAAEFLVGSLSGLNVGIIADSPIGEELLLNSTTYEINNHITANTLRRMLGQKTYSEIFEPILCHLEFNPYNISTVLKSIIDESTGFEIKVINTYNPPKWRFLTQYETNQEIPEQIDELLNHLFLKRDAKEYVLDWLHYSLVKRNQVALILNGDKGVGKGVFSEIVRAVTGPEYFTEAPESLFSSHFNSVLKDNRMIYVDEIKMTKPFHTNMKRLLNDSQAIEEKGKDSRSSTVTYNSFLITCNEKEDMYIEQDDRRFSVPDLTEQPLSEIWNEETTTEFIEKLKEKDSDIVAKFGFFLLYREPVNKIFKAYKGRHFYRLVLSSLKVWQRYVYELIVEVGVEEEIVPLQDLIRGLKKYNISSSMPGKDKMEDFLNTFKVQGKKMGKVVKDEDSWAIKISKHFIKKEYDL